MADSRDDFIIALRYALLKKGNKQKFSLFFLISLSILVIFLDRMSLPFILSTRAVLNDFVYQVTVVASTPGKFINYLGEIKKNHFNVVNKNKILKETLSIGGTTSTEEDFVMPAKVILDQESPYLKSLLINKGTKHGITKGMTVFSKTYLIGRVIETNFLSARVLLVTDLNSKIPVIIQDTDINGILVGTGKKTNLVLEYMPEEFSLEPNKIIYTSGKDGMLTAGIPVAETYLNKKNTIKIKSLADPQQSLIVHVTNGQMSR